MEVEEGVWDGVGDMESAQQKHSYHNKKNLREKQRPAMREFSKPQL